MTKHARAEATFWEERRLTADQAFERRVRLGFLNVKTQRSEGTCLNAAEMVHAVALDLVLVGRDEEARRVFDAIRDLSLASIEGEEKGYYSDTAFAKYMAMRLASTAEWMLGGPNRSTYFGEMLNFLNETIRSESEKVRGEVSDVPEIGGRLAMHYGQAGQWATIMTLPRINRSGGSAATAWRALHKAIRALAEARAKADGSREEARAREAIDGWFLERTDVKRFTQPWDPVLTSNDILCVAEIRGRWIHGVSDPWVIARSIRWPDFKQSRSGARA